MSQPRSVAMESADLDTWGPRSPNTRLLRANFRDPGSSLGWSERVSPSSGLGMLNSQMKSLGLSLKPSPGIQYLGAGFRYWGAESRFGGLETSNFSIRVCSKDSRLKLRFRPLGIPGFRSWNLRPKSQSSGPK